MIARLLCFLFGHLPCAWFRTVSGACSQHPFADGQQCRRCGDLLFVYDSDGVSRIQQRKGEKAPAPAEPCRYHDYDHEACETYSGQVPCDPETDKDEQRAAPAAVPEGMDGPWPLRDCIKKLCEAADILLHNKDYDGHGHEEIATARDTARRLLAPPAPAEPEPAAVPHPGERQIIVTTASGKPAGVDESIAELVSVLNNSGFETVASCSGHGFRPGNIVLKDGRELVIARNYEDGRQIDRLFPLDINGNKVAPAVVPEDTVEVTDEMVSAARAWLHVGATRQHVQALWDALRSAAPAKEEQEPSK